jgi:hypothetical protein
MTNVWNPFFQKNIQACTGRFKSDDNKQNSPVNAFVLG